ncbi:MAG: hypothetical protein GX804_01745, partial [Lentisphaerae bacterium]|nr:hypothetical protein [Lentisphaerota bacterium]
TRFTYTRMRTELDKEKLDVYCGEIVYEYAKIERERLCNHAGKTRAGDRGCQKTSHGVRRRKGGEKVGLVSPETAVATTAVCGLRLATA